MTVRHELGRRWKEEVIAYILSIFPAFFRYSEKWWMANNIRLEGIPCEIQTRFLSSTSRKRCAPPPWMKLLFVSNFPEINHKESYSPHLYSGQHLPALWVARQPDFFSHLMTSQVMSGGRHTHCSHIEAVGMTSFSLYRTSSETHTANHNFQWKRTSHVAAGYLGVRGCRSTQQPHKNQKYCLTFRGPCIVIYSYNKTNEMH